MRKIGTMEYYSGNEKEITYEDYYCENDKYFFIDRETKEKTEISEIDIAKMVANAWDTNFNSFECEKQEDCTYTVTMYINLYDGIAYLLYGYGNEEKNALEDVKNSYNKYIKIYQDYVEEKKKENETLMLSVHRFAILPKNRKVSTLDGLDEYYGDVEIIYFDDGSESLKDLIIAEGIPSDARSDEAITGYVKDNEIIFTRSFFIRDEFRVYKETINRFLPELREKYKIQHGSVRYCR